MSTKKIIKYLLVGMVGLFIGKVLVKEFFDIRPFKFEKYRTEEQLGKAAKIKFPVGGNLDQAISDLERSGADCGMELSHCCDPNKISVDCRYMTSLFSLHPMEDYEIWLGGDKNYRTINHVGAQRTSGLVFIEI